MSYRCYPPNVTRESILANMKALLPKTTYEDKYYTGYFDGEKLVAVMKLILCYPNEETAFVEECFSFLRNIGYRFIRLGFAKGNPQSEAF